MVQRHELSDTQWKQLQPLLPPQKPAEGRPNLDHRPILNGLLWRLKTGAPWRDIPERFGNWQTIYSRFRHWQRTDVWHRLLERLQADRDATGDLDWTLHFVDGSVIRAHQHAAGAKKGTHKPSGAARAASAPRSMSASNGAASLSALS